MTISQDSLAHAEIWSGFFKTPDDAARVRRKIEIQFAQAEAEGRDSYLQGVIDRAIAAAKDARAVKDLNDPRAIRARDYRDALQGDPRFVVRLENMMDEAYVDDIIELYFVATSQYSLLPIFRDCQAMMADPATQAKASKILQHVAPIAAKRQPAVLLTFPLLLVAPDAQGNRPLTVEKAEHCLLKAVARCDGNTRPALSLKRARAQAPDAEANAMLERVIAQAELKDPAVYPGR